MILTADHTKKPSRLIKTYDLLREKKKNLNKMEATKRNTNMTKTNKSRRQTDTNELGIRNPHIKTSHSREDKNG